VEGKMFSKILFPILKILLRPTAAVPVYGAINIHHLSPPPLNPITSFSTPSNKNQILVG